MIALLLGLVTLLVLMGALGQFSRARVDTIKQFGMWVAALGGLVVAAGLFLTGRGVTAIAALALLGPLFWSWLRPPAAVGNPGRGRQAPVRGGPMTRDEAYAVLGLRPGASDADIRAAYTRLMRAAHPDSGGSDWLAARINQARDVLLG